MEYNQITNMNTFNCLRAVNGSVTLAPAPTRPFPERCAFGQFLCNHPPRCIPDWQHCDGQAHCLDGSDEAACRKFSLQRCACVNKQELSPGCDK